MQVALIQIESNGASKAKRERLEHAERLLERARGAELILLPELWNVGYFAFPEHLEESEPLEESESLDMIAAWARELGSYILAGSILERSQDRFHNTSVLISPQGERLAVYRKIHLFDYCSREKELLTPGDRVVVAETELGTVGLSICYDLRFPELYRQQVELGAQLLLVPAAWPAARVDHWRLLARARALENQCFLLGCNAAGTERGVRYGGHSLAVGPEGELLAEAGEGEEILRARVELAQLERVRQEFPVLQDRRLQLG